MLALAEYRAGLCPGGCGQPVSESTAHHDHGPDYDVKRITCRACATVLESQRAAGDGGKGDNQARLWTVIRHPRQKAVSE